MSKSQPDEKLLRGAIYALVVLTILILGGIAALFGIDFDTEAVLDEVDQVLVVQTPSGVEISDSGPGWYEIYFTDPQCAPEGERRGGMDAILAEEIRAARRSVDVAAFEIDSDPLVDALVDAEARGLTVRIVTDADYGDVRSVRRLRRGGISVVEDRRSALMHNKFLVLDGQVVWTGSMNLTSNGVYCNNNNFVRFALPELAANYTAEMDEMYVENAFGPTSPVNVPYPTVAVQEARVETLFGAEEEIAPVLADLVSGAREQILFLTFSFTNDIIGAPLEQQARAGVEIRGVFEAAGSETAYSLFAKMLELSAGLPNISIRQDGNSRIMHHKVLVLDGAVTVLGSYNFSNNANDANDENVVVVYDPVFASYFVEEFETVWNEAAP